MTTNGACQVPNVLHTLSTDFVDFPCRYHQTGSPVPQARGSPPQSRRLAVSRLPDSSTPPYPFGSVSFLAAIAAMPATAILTSGLLIMASIPPSFGCSGVA